MFALSNISFTYPLLSLGYVLAAVLSFMFLKDDINRFRWAGELHWS